MASELIASVAPAARRLRAYFAPVDRATECGDGVRCEWTGGV